MPVDEVVMTRSVDDQDGDQTWPGTSPNEPSVRRRVLTLATPVIGENLLQTLIGIVDTLFVARLGSDALAGVGTSIQVIFFVLSALSAVAIGSSILVSHAVGARTFDEAGTLARQSIIWGMILAVPLAIVGTLFAQPIVALFGTTPAVTTIAAGYLQITLATSFLLMLTFACGSVLRGAGDTRTPFYATLISNVVNAVAAWALIFGHVGMPALGSNGSAWAAALGRAVSVSVLLLVLWRGSNGVTIRGRFGWMPRWAVARNIFALGIPAALEQMLISTAFTLLLVLIARLGTDALAAQRVAGNAMSVSFLPGFGFAIAATALVGQSLGARRADQAESAAYEAMKWAILWMSSVGILYFVAGDWIMRAFSTDEGVIAMGAQSLRAIALIQPFWAVVFVLSGGLRGGGNTRFPLIVNASTMWAAVALGWFLVNTLHFGMMAAWLSFVAVAPFSAAAVVWRFRRGDWKETHLSGALPPDILVAG